MIRSWMLFPDPFSIILLSFEWVWKGKACGSGKSSHSLTHESLIGITAAMHQWRFSNTRECTAVRPDPRCNRDVNAKIQWSTNDLCRASRIAGRADSTRLHLLHHFPSESLNESESELRCERRVHSPAAVWK